MHTRTLLALPLAVAMLSPGVRAEVWTDPEDPELPPDIGIQGEYLGEVGGGEKLGAQVIALGDGAFQAVLYPGGLPGAGWDGKNKILLDGTRQEKLATFKPAEGERKYLAQNPKEFSATREFPPEGHKPYTGLIVQPEMGGSTDEGKMYRLKRTIRESPTLGAEPPEGALVLFDGTAESMKHWEGGRFDEKTKLLNTDGNDIKTKEEFLNYTMHLEFMLPFRPGARGQGRGNSGFYQVDLYEMQILDSFGLMGLDNECGGIYQKKDPDVNMCLPPLQWQTYDVEFASAVVENGEKTKNAVFTAKHNGVTIHDQFEIPGKTGGSRNDPEGTPGPVKLQGHGNPLQFRNVWIVPK